MLKSNEKFNPPLEERLYIFPDAREKLFLNLIENYKIFFPNLQIIYASLNFSVELKADYIVIFYLVKNNKPLILWDCPFMYTNRCIPAYRYAVKTNQFKNYFDCCGEHFCQMDYSRFREYLVSPLAGELSFDEKSPKYWLDPNNTYDVIKAMVDLSLLYRPNMK